jgi:hypothetical protein
LQLNGLYSISTSNVPCLGIYFTIALLSEKTEKKVAWSAELQFEGINGYQQIQ